MKGERGAGKVVLGRGEGFHISGVATTGSKSFVRSWDSEGDRGRWMPYSGDSINSASVLDAAL